jgi:hypothetical protein
VRRGRDGCRLRANPLAGESQKSPQKTKRKKMYSDISATLES